MKIEGNILITECTAYDFKEMVEKAKIKDWLKSISAFANTAGGTLYFGVDNNGGIVGLDDAQIDSDFISEKIKAHLDPIPSFRLVPHEINDKKILEVIVDAGNLTPYYIFMNKTRTAYVRVGNESVQANSHQLLNLVLKGTNHSWDSLVTTERAEDHTFAMLRNAFAERTDVVWDDKLLISLGLVTSDGLLTNAGLLFADYCNLRQSQIYCTRWNGLEKDNAINDSEYQGNILHLMKMGLEFIKANTAKRWYKLPQYRLNFPEYSERALEEACINHLIHRDYTFLGSEVHIDIYDDRLEFYSPGGMFDGTSIQDQDPLSVPSVRRNPVIADVLSQLSYMEKRGSGFKKMKLQTSLLPTYTEEKKPTYRSTPSSFFTTFRNVNYGLTESDFEAIIDSELKKGQWNGPRQTTERLPENEEGYQKRLPVNHEGLPEKVTRKSISPSAQRIIDILQEDASISISLLASKLNLSATSIKKHLATLKDMGIIERVGPDKGGYWKVHIRK